MADNFTVAERAADKPRQYTHKIIDADAHVDPPYDMWKQYLPAHLAELAPRVVEGEEHDWIEFEGKRKPLHLMSNQGGKSGKDFKIFGRLREARAAWDPTQRIADMDEDGIEQAILFGGGPLPTKNSELYIESYNAYSRWVGDFCRASDNRLHAIGYVPMRNVEETIAQVQGLAKAGFKAINIPAFPQNPDGFSTSAAVKNINEGQGAALTGDQNSELQYWQPEFDKLWAVICDLDLTVTFHLGARTPRYGDKKHFLADMPMSKLAMAEPISIFIFHGILQRFPKLRIATVESGVGWMAWFTEYVDRVWEKQRFWTESMLTEAPSFFMERQVYGSFIQDRTGILNRNLPGGRNIMWSSDYPHTETTFPNSHAIIERDFEGVPEADVREITAERCRRLFNLD